MVEVVDVIAYFVWAEANGSSLEQIMRRGVPNSDEIKYCSCDEKFDCYHLPRWRSPSLDHETDEPREAAEEQRVEGYQRAD